MSSRDPIGRREMDSAVNGSPPNEGIKTARAAIRILLIVVFLGYIMIWIMMPTNTYRQIWLPDVRAKANSTYFGVQGPTILVYTFPILFIAALGCVYLHLGKKSGYSITRSTNSDNHHLAMWKRPVLVKGPLGIVSGIELSFFIMFIALLVWSFATYIHVSFANITPQSAEKSGEKVWEAKLDSAALRLGLVGNICLAFLFFPVTRGSSVLPLVGLTSEASIKYHIWLGHIVMTLFTTHGLCYIIFWASTDQISEMLKWDKIGVSNVAGELALLFGLAMWATSFPRIRRKMFELFFYTHNLYVLFLLFFILHVGISYSCIMLPGFYLFVIDRYLRFLQSRQRVRLVSARLLPCETVELNFSKNPGLSYTPTSTIFINVPSISKLQWHPFTISSNSNLDTEKLSVVIKTEGSWSQKLYQTLSSPSSLDRLDVSVEGPYGPASTHFLRHDTLVMVSGGSGITPFISIIRELIFRSTTLSCKTPRVLLICAFKNSADLTMLDLLLPVSGAPDISHLELEIEAYITRDKEATTDNQKLLRTVWFKPNASDAPISSILGPNSWLWLGAIISSSFVIFLILMGILTRYYIFPIDHNTNKIYSYSSRAVLNMLFICICIAMTASLVFLRNKKQNAMEAKQIQNMDAPTPMTSPGSWFYNADRELESLPHQSLVQATKVHFGKRPDLKKMLFECQGSSVGVLVCGPRKMRHEVANICSSGLADNLYFESISFSW
ncbi:hypothetical protein HHK36_027665 [Tetracentron sinense]|uniref:ferric-chelate reductase (NADH) n=1 Tax=Tetracentron sinense TaxID=13715 RepID=A0A834YDG2_TETSI|nr:hypothetical protein HHK36_027665 [Tetracentron sinense]